MIETELGQALEKAEAYEWIAAAEFYGRALAKLDIVKETAPAAEIAEQQAKCYFKAAFQATSRNEFLHVMKLSEESEQRAASLHESAGSEGLSKRARARALFANFWVQDQPDEKRMVLEKSITLGQESAQIFELHGDMTHLVETLFDLLLYREKAFHLSRDRKELLDLFEGALETAWRIIEEEGLADNQISLETIHALVQLYVAADYVLEQPRYEELEKRLEKLKDRILELSTKIRTTSAEALAIEASLVLAGDLEGDIPKTRILFEKGISKAKELRDLYMIGRLNLIASAMARWAALSEEFVEKRREQLEKAIELAQNAIDNFQPSSPGAWLKRAYGVKLDASNYLALTVETDIDRKRSVLRKAIDTTRKAMVYERQSFVTGMGHQLSRAMYLLATMDTGPEEKTRLLKEALPIREEIVRTFEQLSPHSFSRGVALNYLAQIKSELSKLETDDTRRRDLLKEASSDMEKCARLCTTLTGIAPPLPGQVRAWAQYSEWQGDVLQQLYDATLETSHGHEAVDAYQQAITYLSKSDSLGPIPPVRWKIAQTYDLMKEYHESSESFRQAAAEYRAAGKKIIGLAGVFEDYSQYMESWAIIEEARLSHEREQYTTSAEGYTKVANALRTLKDWNHLSKHYSACSFLELGEAMSRQERQHGAIESFNAAKTNFHQSNRDLEQKLATSQLHEKRELMGWLELSRGRLKYVLARLQLEEAKVLDARMEEEASSAKYLSASESFRKLLAETRHQPTRLEIETLSILCDAWAKMKSAEANASAELYAEAASRFRLVETKAVGKKTRLAALANASMCKALELGSTFRRTRDRHLYEEIKKNLETATDFYEDAGIRKAADWTRATQRFFDALIYLRDAEVETDPRKRAELFHLAENHLQLAATIYGEGGYTKKKQESLRHLERAREEKQLLLMPVEVLAESPAVSEVIVSPVSLIEDRAMGLEKFQNAHVVGSMAVSSKELNAGEQLTIDLQIANMGKTAAMLSRIENLATRGLELQGEKAGYLIEDHSINLQGKRLEYLKSYQLKILLRSRRKGTYEVKPKVTFVDEKGNSGTYEFEPATIRVKEIGVLGWIRGPG